MERGVQLRLFLILLVMPAAIAADIFIDNTLASDCNTYSPENRDCSGSYTAFNTLSEGASAAQAGDTVYIRGTFSEQLVPTNSGTAQNPITFKNYQGEEAIITGTSLNPAIILSNRQHVILDGLKIDNVNRWLYALDTHHCTIRNCEFTRAIDSGHSQKACLFFQEATYNAIENNHIEDCAEDSISLIKSDFNLVQNNTVIKGYHVLWAVKCGNNNVIRANYFHNDIEKIGEIFDCHDVGFDHEFNNILNSTKHNVVEQNVFAYVPPNIDKSPYSGIQFAGQNCIIRNNVFYNNIGPGLQMTLYTFAEAHYNLENRVYNNVFYNNSFGGISITGSESYYFYDNIIKNNILIFNDFKAYDDRWAWYRNIDGRPVQLLSQRLDGFLFENNNLYSGNGDEEYLITYGNRDDSVDPAQYTVAWWNANHPGLFISNMAVNPMFVSAEDYDFSLQDGSPMADSGVFLTYATTSGTGTEMPVEDALYFHDGSGIVEGDVIQLESSSELASIKEVDYDNNILSLDRPLSWSQGQGVSLAYAGSGPGLGASSYAPGYIPVCTPMTISALNQEINAWKGGSRTILQLMAKILEWKQGC